MSPQRPGGLRKAAGRLPEGFRADGPSGGSRGIGGVTDCSFILPAHNEAAPLRRLLPALRAELDSWGVSGEALVVDDGSRDGTAEAARAAARQWPAVRVVTHPARRGVGAAFRTGLAASRGRHVMLLPADGEIVEASLRAVWEARGRAEVVVGVPTRGVGRPLGRRLLSGGVTRVVRWASGVPLPYFNGPCLLPGEPARALAVGLPDHFTCQAWLLAQLIGRQGRAWVCAETALRPRQGGRSKAFRARHAWELAGTAARLLREVRWSRSPARL